MWDGLIRDGWNGMWWDVSVLSERASERWCLVCVLTHSQSLKFSFGLIFSLPGVCSEFLFSPLSLSFFLFSVSSFFFLPLSLHFSFVVVCRMGASLFFGDCDNDYDDNVFGMCGMCIISV